MNQIKHVLVLLLVFLLFSSKSEQNHDFMSINSEYNKCGLRIFKFPGECWDAIVVELSIHIPEDDTMPGTLFTYREYIDRLPHFYQSSEPPISFPTMEINTLSDTTKFFTFPYLPPDAITEETNTILKIERLISNEIPVYIKGKPYRFYWRFNYSEFNRFSDIISIYHSVGRLCDNPMSTLDVNWQSIVQFPDIVSLELMRKAGVVNNNEPISSMRNCKVSAYELENSLCIKISFNDTNNSVVDHFRMYIIDGSDMRGRRMHGSIFLLPQKLVYRHNTYYGVFPKKQLYGLPDKISIGVNNNRSFCSNVCRFERINFNSILKKPDKKIIQEMMDAGIDINQ